MLILLALMSVVNRGGSLSIIQRPLSRYCQRDETLQALTEMMTTLTAALRKTYVQSEIPFQSRLQHLNQHVHD